MYERIGTLKRNEERNMEMLVMNSMVLGVLSIILFAVVWVVVYLACGIVDRWTGFTVDRADNAYRGVMGGFAAVAIFFILRLF